MARAGLRLHVRLGMGNGPGRPDARGRDLVTPGAVSAVHPERVAGDPRAVRWVVPAGILPVGRLRRAPGRLGELLSSGTLTTGLIEHTAIWLWVAEDQSWSALGAPVRSALLEALNDRGAAGQRWVVEPAAGEVLERVVADVLDGAVGDFAEVHDRMPLVLGPACWDRWLDPEQPAPAEVLAAGPQVGGLAMREVSTLVNRVANNGPELIAPVAVGPRAIGSEQGALFDPASERTSHDRG
ncbi:MAG: hypothetical protein EBU23_08500 [Mycobacteriaceae bacterium]|nr:hypothetical protein [Mycobacteriaceae bacterium]